MQKKTVSQGPYSTEPTFAPPVIEGWAWGSSKNSAGFVRWGQVNDGSWYAFYMNGGPPKGERHFSWDEEHPDDPNFWHNPHAKNNPGPWVCRHGAIPGNCPDPEQSCGPEPRPQVTDEEVVAAGLKALRLLRAMERADE